MDAKANARAAAIRRTGGKVAKKPSSSGKGGADNFAFYSGESKGFEVSPKAVLIISLVYIGVVVMLFIMKKTIFYSE